METIAVIPIFVNAGTAVLPTIMAAAASVALVVFKPRELVHLLGRRPVALGVLAAGLVIGLGITIWYLASSSIVHTGQRDRTTAALRYDWAKVAQEIIAQQQVRQETKATATELTGHAGPARSAVEQPVSMPRAEQNSSHSSTETGPAPLKLAPLWRFCPEDTMFLGAPAVMGSRVFAAGCQTDLGGYTGLLVCLDSESGRPLWQITEIKGEPLRPFFSSPAVTQDGKYLVIGQGLHQDRDCSLLCFDAATGQLRWAVQTSLHIESSPAISGDTAVVGAGAVEGRDGKPVGDPGYCLAVRISDGKELWRQPVNDPESSPAIDEDGIVYIGSGFNGNAVLALRSESDEQLRAKNLQRIAWRTAVAQPIPGPITLAGDVVIAGGGNSDLVHSNRNARGLVVALDRGTGSVLWQTSFDDAVLGAIACGTDTLFCPVRTGEVVALALKDGRTLWRTRISGASPVLGGCTLAAGRIHAASSDGYLAVLNAEDGRVLEKAYLNDQAKPGTGLTLSTPRIAGRRVVVGSETGGLCCLLESGGAE
jgi:outer membrane protein assembly factor BamB